MADTEPKELENPSSNHTANGLPTQNGNSNKDSAQLQGNKNSASTKKLSADAPVFDVSRSPTLDPYAGPNGIRTQPCYVPPATIPPPAAAQQTNANSNNTTNNNNNTNNTNNTQQPPQQQQTPQQNQQQPPPQQQPQSTQPQQASPQQPQQTQQAPNPHSQQRQKARSRQQYPPSYDPHDAERDHQRRMYPHNYQQKMPPQHMGHPRHPHGQYQMGHPQHGKYPGQYPYAMNRNVQHPNQPPYDPHYRHHQQMMNRHPNQYAAPNRDHGPYGMHPPYGPPHPNGTHGSSQHLSSNGTPITSPPQQQVNGSKLSSNGQHSSNQMPSHPAASPPDANNKHSSQQPNGTTSKQPSNTATTATAKQPGKVQFKTFTNQKNARAVGSTMAYKHPSRSHYGQPEAKLRDPKFTNPSGLLHLQRWELLESAKRWLPGEGTLITWKNHRYLIGPPIHMGMNGHIHYCYKYPLPKEKRTRSKQKDSKKDQSAKPGKGDKADDDEAAEEEDENIQEIDINSPCVETLAAKIVPNTPAFAREIVILRALQHCENVTELYEVLESERTLISILELAQADVYNFFVGRGSSRHGWNLDKPAVREHFSKMVISNVVQGLDQMHKAEYLHCDLKSLNILLYIYVTDHSNRRGGVYIKAKLTDFGHSSHGTTRIAEKLFSNGMARVGTAGHVAPELFKEGTKCTEKIDIWSLGIVMFSMLVPGRLLFSEYTNLDALKRGYDRLNKMNPWSRDRPSWWTDFERLSPEARDLILWMTRYDPSQRPTCNEILKHPWFLIGKQGHREHYRPKLKYVDMLCSSSIAQE